MPPRRRAVLGALAYAAASAAASALLACDGAGERVRSLERGVIALAVSDTMLLWATGPEHGALSMAPLGGGAARVLAGGLSWPRQIIVRGEHAFVALAGGVARVPLSGGVAAPLVDTEHGAHRIAADAYHLYWVERHRGTLMRVPLAGGRAEQVAFAPGWANDVAVGRGHIFWSGGDSARKGALRHVAKTGSSVRTMHSATQAIVDTVIDEGHVYWTTPTSIERMRLRGSAVETVAGGLRTPTSLCVRQGFACAIAAGSAPGTADVVAAKLDSGRLRVLASGTRAQTLARAHDAIYWSDAAELAIRRVSNFS